MKQAREQDRQAVSREINREQQQENLELESKQRIASSAQKVQQGQERDALATQQLFDSNTMKLEHGHERAQMQVDFAALQAKKNNLQAAKIKFIGSAINSLLEVGGSVMKIKLEAAEKLEAANSANEAIGLGSTFFDNEPVDTSSVDAENTAIKLNLRQSITLLLIYEIAMILLIKRLHLICSNQRSSNKSAVSMATLTLLLR